MAQQRKLTKQERRARRELMQSKKPPPPKLQGNNMKQNTQYLLTGSGDGPYEIQQGDRAVALLRKTDFATATYIVICLNAHTALLSAATIGDSLGNSGPVLLNHAADLIDRFASITAGELRRKAEIEQVAITKARP